MYTITVSVPTLNPQIFDLLSRLTDAVTVKTDIPAPKQEVLPPAEKPKAAEPKGKPPTFLRTAAADKELFEKVKTITVTLADIDRSLVIDTLAKFGAEKASGLKPEQYADYIKDVTAVIESKKQTPSDNLV